MRLIIISKVYIIIQFLTSTVLSTHLCTRTYILPLHAHRVVVVVVVFFNLIAL